MQQIINFFINNKNFLLFLVLFSLSVFFTIQSHSYHKSKFVTSANFVSGNLYSWSNNVSSYFGLRTENEKLLEENSRLRNQLQKLEQATPLETLDSTMMALDYIVRPAEVINNSYSKTNNYLTLKAGRKDSISPEMGVITSKGIVGIVDQVSTNFSSVMSVLNSKSSISVMLKASGHFGSLVWDGKDPRRMQLIDIARLAPVAVGDTVTTDGRSTIFPKGILVGRVADFSLDQSENFYIIEVELFNDMTRTANVYIIENTRKEEIITLEAASENE
tara:strand:+ start:16843 stop:17667 length:825 start_codon:yes stop_codon:yes gene_type:complete